MKKKGVKRGKEKRRKKRTKRRESKRNVTVCFLWRPFWVFSPGGDLESCGDLSWEDLLEKPAYLSEFDPDSCAPVRVVPVVTDVPVSPSSVVTELCEVFSGCSDGKMLYRSPLLSP